MRIRDFVGSDRVVGRDVRAAHDAETCTNSSPWLSLMVLSPCTTRFPFDCTSITVTVRLPPGYCAWVLEPSPSKLSAPFKVVVKMGTPPTVDGSPENGRPGIVHGRGLRGLGHRALAGAGRFGQANGQHIADAARLRSANNSICCPDEKWRHRCAASAAATRARPPGPVSAVVRGTRPRAGSARTRATPVCHRDESCAGSCQVGREELQHLISGADCLGIHLVGALAFDHGDQFRDRIDVLGFGGSFAQSSPTVAAGRADLWRAAGGRLHQ